MNLFLIQINGIKQLQQSYKYNKIMGTQCCSQEFDKYEIKVGEPQKQHVQQRNGQPSEQIAIKMSDVNTKIKSASKQQQINQLVFKVAEYDKKFKEPFRISKQPLPQNKLPQPYYLHYLQMFYLGEWIYDASINDNLPGGIGRLYEQGTISQGVFKTIILDSDEIQYLKSQERTNQEQINDGDPNFSPNNSTVNQINLFINKNSTESNYKSRIQKLLKAGRQKIVNEVKFIVKLHGQGRISSKQENNQQIQIEGQFFQGLLNGRGTLRKIDNGQETYYYNGSWQKGKKHGKGLQRSLKHRYEGSFHENSKQGKGTQVFIESIRDEHIVQRDIQQMQKKIMFEGENMKVEALKKSAVRQKRQKIIVQELQKFHSQRKVSSHIKYQTQKILITDMNFLMERTHRKAYSEIYSGQFQNGKMEGYGSYSWPVGKFYKGKWKQDKLNGWGQFYWPDGSYYQGSYLNDERYGQGTMVWNVDKRYSGNWAYGMRHGYGQSIEIKQIQTLHPQQDKEQGEQITKMIIKCSIWDRDKVKKSLLVEERTLQGFNDVYKIEKYIQQETMGTNNRFSPSKKKKGNEEQILNEDLLKKLKEIKDNHVSKIEKTLSKFRSD